jgi:hypothetical protein
MKNQALFLKDEKAPDFLMRETGTRQGKRV